MQELALLDAGYATSRELVKRAMAKSTKPARISVYGYPDGPSIYVEAPASAVFRDNRFATTNRFAKLKKVPAYLCVPKTLSALMR